jgi:hypothetical protein
VAPHTTSATAKQPQKTYYFFAGLFILAAGVATCHTVWALRGEGCNIFKRSRKKPPLFLCAAGYLKAKLAANQAGITQLPGAA